MSATHGNEAPKYPVPEDMGWTHRELDGAENGYCRCGRQLVTDEEHRDGVCRECL